MNRKNNKRKGFTIVELVIVIAVIGILAGVMIPTFGGIIEKSQDSARDQKVAALYKDDFLVNFDFTTETLTSVNGYYSYTEGTETYYYTVTDGEIVLDGIQPIDAPSDITTTNHLNHLATSCPCGKS